LTLNERELSNLQGDINAARTAYDMAMADFNGDLHVSRSGAHGGGSKSGCGSKQPEYEESRKSTPSFNTEDDNMHTGGPQVSKLAANNGVVLGTVDDGFQESSPRDGQPSSPEVKPYRPLRIPQIVSLLDGSNFLDLSLCSHRRAWKRHGGRWMWSQPRYSACWARHGSSVNTS
jgi:hypothetical protein